MTETASMDHATAKLNAAVAVGFQTPWVMRPKDVPVTPNQASLSHPMASNFDDFRIDEDQSPSKYY